MLKSLKIAAALLALSAVTTSSGAATGQINSLNLTM